MQPWCVQIALKHAAVDAVGRETITAEPSGSFAETHWPTVIASSETSLLSPAALGVDPAEPDPPPLQAARASAPAPTAPAVSAPRRVISRAGAGVVSLLMVTITVATEAWFSRAVLVFSHEPNSR